MHALLLVAAPALAVSPAENALPLAGTSWRLVQFQGSDDATRRPDDRARYTITFGSDGGLVVRFDCNRGRGAWKSPGPSQLELSPLALTRAQCPPGSLHDLLVKHWSDVRSYVIKGDHLFLALLADGGIYEFEPSRGAEGAGVDAAPGTASPGTRSTPAAAPGSAATRIEGPAWRLTQLRGPTGEALAALPRPPTLRLDAGRVQAFDGCNRLTGSYTIEGDRVTFDELAGTLMGCMEPTAAVEQAFKKALTGTLRFRIVSGALTLSAIPGPYPELTFVAEPRPAP